MTGQFVFNLHLDFVARPGMILARRIGQRDVEVVHLPNCTRYGVPLGCRDSYLLWTERRRPQEPRLHHRRLRKFRSDLSKIAGHRVTARTIGIEEGLASLRITTGLAPETGIGLPVRSAVRGQLDLHLEEL